MKNFSTQHTENKFANSIDFIINRYNVVFEAKIAVAVSGGIDSLALALLLKNWSRNRHDIHAIIIDHKLRPNSSEQAAITSLSLNKLNIANTVLIWKHGVIAHNIENEARKARYNLLTQYCIQNNIKHLFLGHHLNDQIETFLMNIQRGSGIDGLASMPDIRKENDILLIRPLLSLTKEELKQYLLSQGTGHIEDESNCNTDFTRNKIRHVLTQIDPSNLLARRIAATIKSLRQIKEVMDRNNINNINKFVKFHNERYAEFSRIDFQNLLPEEKLNLLTSVLLRISGNTHKPRLKELEQLIHNLGANLYKGQTLGDCEIIIKKDNVIIIRERRAIQSLQINDHAVSSRTILWDNYFHIIVQFLVDNFFKIEIKPIELNDYKSIQKNILPLKKILLTLPCLYVEDELISIPHINYIKHSNIVNIKVK